MDNLIHPIKGCKFLWLSLTQNEAFLLNSICENCSFVSVVLLSFTLKLEIWKSLLTCIWYSSFRAEFLKCRYWITMVLAFFLSFFWGNRSKNWNLWNLDWRGYRPIRQVFESFRGIHQECDSTEWCKKTLDYENDCNFTTFAEREISWDIEKKCRNDRLAFESELTVAS
jgi:hypothetical protein